MIKAENKKAFTLVELLVVISVIALLMGLLMPALSAARSQARSVVCKANLHQLLIANIGYATENDGFYVPGAEDMYKLMGGFCRWHGKRKTVNDPFDPNQSLLIAYLGDGKVKECPGKPRLTKGSSWGESFEKGGGGYGYNMTYLGSRVWQKTMDWRDSYRMTTKMSEVRMPANTLMFADCAMSMDGQLIEYSFAEQPFVVISGMVFDGNGTIKMSNSSPSIHFRHRGQANIGWADGHVNSMRMSETDTGKNAYGDDSFSAKLGWFDPLDNSLFDLK